jgi:hypothetical protein
MALGEVLTRAHHRCVKGVFDLLYTRLSAEYEVKLALLEGELLPLLDPSVDLSARVLLHFERTDVHLALLRDARTQGALPGWVDYLESAVTAVALEAASLPLEDRRDLLLLAQPAALAQGHEDDRYWYLCRPPRGSNDPVLTVLHFLDGLGPAFLVPGWVGHRIGTDLSAAARLLPGDVPAVLETARRLVGDGLRPGEALTVARAFEE